MSEDFKGMGLDDALAELGEEQVDEVQVLARAALSTIFVLFRLTTIHSLNNKAFAKPMETMLRVFEAYRGRGGSFALMLRGDNFFVNNVMVKLDSASFTAAEYLAPVWEALGIGAITGRGRISEENVKALLEGLLETLQMPTDQRHGHMVGMDCGPLEVHAELTGGDPLLEVKREAQRLYAILTIALNEFIELGQEGRFPPLNRMKRLSQRLVDLAARGPEIVGGLATFHGGEEHERYHPVNVCIIALMIGRAIQMPARDLSILSIAALLHDMGMNDGVGPKSGRPIPEAVDLLTRFKGLNEHTLSWTVTADELAMFSRYIPPRPKWYHGGEGPGISSRILNVAHRYERLINAAPERAVSPHTAMLALMQNARKECDPRVVRALYQAFGLFPVGTVVELTDGSLAVVTKKYDSPPMAVLPTVRPIPGHEGSNDPSKLLELGDPGCRNKIAAAVQPRKLRINPIAEILL
jgi:hypothetical protein